MSALDVEELARLRAIDTSVLRREHPSFEELTWLIEAAYNFSKEVDKLETGQEERIDVAESRLEDALHRIEELEEQCAHWKATAMIREAAATSGGFKPERLKFLRRSLSACLDSVDRALVGDPGPNRKRRKQ